MKKMTKKERESSKKFSRIKHEFKKLGFDVSNVKKSHKTYSNTNRIRKDILSQLGIETTIGRNKKLLYDKEAYNNKLNTDIRKNDDYKTANELQSIFGNQYNVSSDDEDNETTYVDDDGEVEYFTYEDFANLDGARDDFGEYGMIVEFYSELGESIANADTIYITREQIDSIENDRLRKWAQQVYNK